MRIEKKVFTEYDTITSLLERIDVAEKIVATLSHETPEVQLKMMNTITSRLQVCCTNYV